MKRSLTLCLLALLPSPLLAKPEIEPLRRLAVQDGGRTKPLDSFARDLARRVQGARAFSPDGVQGLEPAEWLLSMMAQPEKWRAEPIVRVTHAGLRERAGLPEGRDRFSLAELAAHPGFNEAMRSVQAKGQSGEDLDPVDREVADLFDTLSTLHGVMTGESLRIVPHPQDPKATWWSVADLRSGEPPQAQRLRALVSALVVSYSEHDRAGVQTAASALSRRLADSAPGIYPRAKDLGIEVHYNTLRPFRLA